MALDTRLRVKRVGQPVTGTLLEPVYAYDRVVLPAGIKVLGHIVGLAKVSGGRRLRGVLNGDLSPARAVTLQFDSLVLADGATRPISTEVRSATEHLALQARPAPEKNLVAQAGAQLASQASDSLAAVRAPRKLQRLKYALVGALPFHPQYLAAGTVFGAVLTSSLDFGVVAAIEAAPPGTAPPPDSILHVRLVTALDSATTPRGSRVEVVVTQPLLSDDQRLILPEGVVMTGEVTYAKAAASFRRNGQLRFLLEAVQQPEQDPKSLRASLYSVQRGSDEHVVLDDEGGVTIVNSKTRFAAPALASLALGLSMRGHVDTNTDGLGPELNHGTTGSTAAGGFFGLSLTGAALSQLSHPVAIGFGILGVARTVFVSFIGKGRNVSFPADTAMEVQLGPTMEPEGARTSE